MYGGSTRRGRSYVAINRVHIRVSPSSQPTPTGQCRFDAYIEIHMEQGAYNTFAFLNESSAYIVPAIMRLIKSDGTTHQNLGQHHLFRLFEGFEGGQAQVCQPTTRLLTIYSVYYKKHYSQVCVGSVRHALDKTIVQPYDDTFKDARCSICLDGYSSMSKMRKLRCGHIFHLHCLYSWLIENKDTCPVCRHNAFWDT